MLRHLPAHASGPGACAAELADNAACTTEEDGPGAAEPVAGGPAVEAWLEAGEPDGAGDAEAPGTGFGEPVEVHATSAHQQAIGSKGLTPRHPTSNGRALTGVEARLSHPGPC
jgi:hypothetical protein